MRRALSSVGLGWSVHDAAGAVGYFTGPCSTGRFSTVADIIRLWDVLQLYLGTGRKRPVFHGLSGELYGCELSWAYECASNRRDKPVRTVDSAQLRAIFGSELGGVERGG